MRRTLFIVAACAAAVTAGVVAWRRNPRIGTRFVNDVVNPALLRKGFAGRGRSELGTLEHVGRRSGVRRLTPVHPEPTADGFRIVVPLGAQSAWARNVLAAGHCRLQLHDTVYELDEPALVPPSEVDRLPTAIRGLEQALGFRYLVLRKFGAAPGSLEAESAEASVVPAPADAGVVPVGTPLAVGA
ncbi:MAG TPA: hypothetical protein VFX65_05790 [Candidatus Limnocylindrales bacterium]|nr:hypothetical protein [Candidatus Limnocylindrales bacterium]